MLFRLLALVGCVGLALGCSDARSRFDAFTERAGVATDHGGDAGPDCDPPAPNDLSGRAVLAVDTSLGSGKPIIFVGELSTPETDGKTGLRYECRALDATDRKTPVGDPLLFGPFVIERNGDFEGPVENLTLPGAANPVLVGVPVTSTIVLRGKFCGVSDFYCGTVSGEVIKPLQGEITGNYGLTLLDGAAIPAQPRYGCASDALAPPL